MAERSNTGRRTGSRPAKPGRANHSLDLSSTINAALVRHAASGSSRQKISLRETDLHVQVRSQQPQRLVIFLIDTSDSMGDGPTARISAALGASMTLAARSYLSRDQVCLITFRDRSAQLVVPPTKSVSRLQKQLQKLPIGGATPLAAGLQKAQAVINQAHLKSPQTTPLLVLLSDGEATASLAAGADPQTEALALAAQLPRENFRALVIDTLTESRRHGFMKQIAAALGAECHHIHDLHAGGIVQLINNTETEQP